MHPSLSPAALHSLPLSLRASLQRTAVAAAKGSLKDFTKLLGDVPALSPISHLLLPALYGLLDPMQAERLEGLDFIATVGDTALLLSAFLAVDRLWLLPDIPKECYGDLWPRLWRWSLLIMRHNYCVRQYIREEFHITIIQLFSRLHRNCERNAKTISATPGLRQLVARVWVLLSRKTNSKFSDYARDDVLDFIHFGLDLKNREHLNDLVEGCGGSLVHFSDVLVGFFTNLASDNAHKSFRLMTGAFSVLEHTTDIWPEFPQLFLNRGIVRAQVVMLRRLASHSPPKDFALDKSYHSLISNFLDFPSEERMVEAVRAGLLQLIASALQTPRLISWHLLELTIVDLSGYSPYRSVVAQLWSSIAEVDATIDATLASRSPLWKSWRQFHDSVSEMVNTLRIHRAPDLPPMRACDNIERLDWRRGHNQTCAKIRTHFLRKSPPTGSLSFLLTGQCLDSPELLTTQSSRDESFLRTVAFATYHARLPFILLEELSYMLKYPDQSGPFVCFFDIQTGELTFSRSAESNLERGHRIKCFVFHRQEANHVRHSETHGATRGIGDAGNVRGASTGSGGGGGRESCAGGYA
ncbi:hypothetical protein FB45DRAFT_870561 [Roridomyces roridus]|uniref:Uncharacterized protein n=1 Tax=Roridomyces roridus TaxID=1738132 RepID=A0AAD7BIW9_9AGAR|nr:hypothetical protein FB45DRAFT_870561 [Roridomyces roridus]